MPPLNIVWLPPAVTDKDEILDYIAEHSPIAALGVDAQIEQQVSQLADYPFIGRKGRIENTYELLISRTPYLVAYQIRDNQIQILHVFHERRNWHPVH
jgi:toxin ParE1/3/4